MHAINRTRLESLESRRMLSAVPFSDGQSLHIYEPLELYTSADLSTSDLDGDGDLDLVVGATRTAQIDWLENQNGEFGSPKQIHQNGLLYDYAVGDVDGDSSPDIVTWSHNNYELIRNSDAGVFAKPVSIFDSDRLGSPQLIDIDGDGDQDLLGSRARWLENVDGKGSFQIEHQWNIPTNRGVRDIKLIDMDGDGDLDILAAHIPSYASRGQQLKVNWYENESDNTTLGTEHPIGAIPTLLGFGGTYAEVDSADIDGDGDLDVLVSSRYISDTGTGFGAEVAWFEHQNDGYAMHSIANDGFGNSKNLAHPPQKDLQFADIDGDGDLDISFSFATGIGIGSVAWLENTDGNGTFQRSHFIGEESTVAQVTADYDQDGDADVVALHDRNGSLILYSNESEQRQLGDIDANGAIDSRDIDLLYELIDDGNNDAFLDLYDDEILNQSDVDFLVESILNTAYGDANLNGVFDSADLIAIFQKAQYEDGIDSNSDWSSGDWNGDKEFDSSDLILAFSRSRNLRAVLAVQFAAAVIDLTDNA